MKRRPAFRLASLLAGLLPGATLAMDGATLPLPPMPISQALALARDQGLVPEAPQALSDGLLLHVALPVADRCSPAGAWLLCPGLRMASAGAAPWAPLVAAWWTRDLAEPTPLAQLRAEAIGRLGPPAVETGESDSRRGLDLTLHRLAWHLPGPPPLLLEVRYVLEDDPQPAPGAAPLARRVAWSAVPVPR
ncbi:MULTISPECIES: hypothetical protein [Roseomonadaceae]|uniref:DUF4390 domain-containing protein n=1 Tax=Falsiroseomonas oleicola TaxID=2801474 RepID=A0ABS6H5M9_9PROT|nr:hypothetical protein [Roseomonas oleicola]MBU8543696.1 hypothetical protein [Roseomonas oleicola]